MSKTAVAALQISDHPALICGYRFDAEGFGHAAELPLGQQEDTVADSQEVFHWWHFNAAHVGTEQWLRKHLAPEHVERCLSAMFCNHRSSHIEMIDDTLVAVLNDVEFDLTPGDTIDIASLWLMVTPTHMISVRAKPLRSVDRLRQAVRGGTRFHSPLALAVHLLRDQGDVLLDVLRTIATQVDLIEDQVEARRRGDQRQQLGSLRRDLLRLQRLLAPEPAALFRLLNRPPAELPHQDWEDLQQATEELAMILREVATQQERIKLLQGEISAALSERTDRSLFILTAVTVVALPINIIAGLFGMNVGGIPFSEDKSGFWRMVFIAFAIAGLVAWLLSRDRRRE